MDIRKEREMEKKTNLYFQNRPLVKFVTHLIDKADNLMEEKEKEARMTVIKDLMATLKA